MAGKFAKAVIGFLLLGAVASAARAQAPAVEAAQPLILRNTETRDIHSDINGVDYRLYVSLPRGYGESEERYRTLYLLDADYSFLIVRNVVEHFADRGNVPPMIIVGVAYPGGVEDLGVYRRNRTRDYTPTHTPEGGYGPEIQALSGGGPAFRDFLGDELIPYIDRQYRTNGVRGLSGHSFGGLFATFVMLTRPELFDDYLIVSPSLWYDEGVIFRIEDAYAANHDDLPARAMFTVGAYENQPQNGRAMVDDMMRLRALLEGRGYAGFESFAHVFEGETHNSVYPAAITRSLSVLY
ncbi:MAG: alpha/beta hydrolase-fold protein [Parvularculaceae bacterium]